MANNANVNKVTYNGQVLIDLTTDTVTAADVKKGVTFHLPNGRKVEGTLEVPTKIIRSVQNYSATSAVTRITITIDNYTSLSGVTDVYKNGFKLAPSEYSISGTTLTLNKTANKGSVIEICCTYLGV